MVIAMATGTPSLTHPPPSVLYVPLLFLFFSVGGGAACSLGAGGAVWVQGERVSVVGLSCLI